MSQFQCNTLRVACCLLVCCCCCCLWYFFLFPVLLFHEYSNSLVASFNSLGMRAANKKSLQKIIILFCNFVRYFCYSLCGIFTFCCCTVLLCSACITTGMICSVACGRRMWTVEWSCPLVEVNCDGHECMLAFNWIATKRGDFVVVYNVHGGTIGWSVFKLSHGSSLWFVDFHK